MNPSANATAGSAPADRELWVVVPVYNEGAALAGVVEEWLPVIRSCTDDFVFCLIDDGSTDDTATVIHQLARAHPQIATVTQRNTGHGRACLHGYRLAIQQQARWILQIDSDGQCLASDFPALWARRTRHPVVFGFRRSRDDGAVRLLLSRLNAFGVWAATGLWVRDPNVPYRLMAAAVLLEAITVIPADVDMANIYLAATLAARESICWVDIGFRERAGGAPHLKVGGIARKGVRLLYQLTRDRHGIRQPPSRSAT